MIPKKFRGFTMKLLIQRVTQGSVTVGGVEISKIDAGVVVLVGISRTDTAVEAKAIADHLVNLPLFCDENGKWTSLLESPTKGLLLANSLCVQYLKEENQTFIKL